MKFHFGWIADKDEICEKWRFIIRKKIDKLSKYDWKKDGLAQNGVHK